MIKLCIPDIGEEEIEAIREVINSKYLVHGDRVEEFEYMIKEYLNVKHAIAVSSGTAALHLGLLALEVKRGDEVVVPDFTFPATANVVEAVEATTKFVDIDLNSFCIDVTKIEEQITENTKVIMPVQEFGQSSNMNKIMRIASKYNLKVVEDAACALGAEYQGQKVGTIGDLGCFSLHPRKAITTGEGGIVVTNDDQLADKIRSLRNHGISYENGKAEFILPGLNYRMTNIQGAMAVVQMKKLKIINEKRKLLAEKYNEILKDIKGITVPKEIKGMKHVWQTYHVLLDERYDRDKIIVKLKEQGIETNIGAHAVHIQKYYKDKYGYFGYENSLIAYKQGVALPLHNGLSEKQIEFIVQCLLKMIK